MRYTRHELKQDKFVASTAEAIQEVSAHRALVIKIAVIVVVLGAIIGSSYWYVTNRQQRASDALGQALVAYSAPVVPPGTPQQGSMITFNSDRERLTAAKKAFYAISDAYGWTASGQYARYLAGICETELGNYKVAEDQLRAIGNVRSKELAALAKYALASVYRDEGRSAEAISTLQSLADQPTATVPKASAQLAIADIYVADHQPDKAKVIYDQLAKSDAKDAIGEIATSHLDALK